MKQLLTLLVLSTTAASASLVPGSADDAIVLPVFRLEPGEVFDLVFEEPGVSGAEALVALRPRAVLDSEAASAAARPPFHLRLTLERLRGDRWGTSARVPSGPPGEYDAFVRIVAMRQDEPRDGEVDRERRVRVRVRRSPGTALAGELDVLLPDARARGASVDVLVRSGSDGAPATASAGLGPVHRHGPVPAATPAAGPGERGRTTRATPHRVGEAPRQEVTGARPRPPAVSASGGNQSPTGVADSFTNVIVNTLFEVSDVPGPGPFDPPRRHVTGNLLANDTDPDPGDQANLVVQAVSGVATQHASGTGRITIHADGTFLYSPPVGASGDASTATYEDRFTYTVQDPGGLTDTADVNFSILMSPVVWYVDGSQPAGDGRSDSPYNSTASFNGSGNPGPGDTVFVHSRDGTNAPYAPGVVLQNTQTLLGEGVDLVIDGTLLVDGRPDERPVLTSLTGNGIDLASGNTVRGFRVGDTAGSGIAGTNVGALDLGKTVVLGQGRALHIVGGASVSIDLQAVHVANSDDGGVHLADLVGSTTLRRVKIKTTGGVAFHVENVTTLSVPGQDNVIHAVDGLGVQVTGTSLGAGGVHFQSITSTGTPNGMILSTSAGAFTIATAGQTP